jgi:ParB family chromosome partitioning protein
VRELAAWIESNILLQLAAASFDKQDETLVPAAGSCSNCPKRTGYNKLLFAEVRKDSCTDPQCFRAKIDAHVSKTLETKPQLVQISSAWNTRVGAPLGKNRYVELEIKKAKTNGTSSKVAPYQKPCEKMTEAVVMDGGRRGELVKVCANLSCRVHHPDTPSITTRHCVLAKVLERVSAPLKKADLLTLAQYTIGQLSYNQVPVLAKRHKVETAKPTKPPQEVLMKKVSTYDEASLSRLLLEISLLDSAYQRGDVSQDLLMDAAKRYRVDVEIVEKAVATEFAAKRSKQPKAKAKPKPKSVS